ncbi:MAG: glycosyltransferase family 9 protein [Isosphaeraceae bacterium]|nr:glycosyltransferase family 9 protein [Isosphaeraceae bacterium]
MSAHDLRVEGVRKIAVLRANALGDFLFAMPALEALHAAYREAEIVLLGQHWHAQFLAGRPGPVDRVVVVPYGRGIYDPPPGMAEDAEAQERFFDAMTRERFDLAVQLHGGGRHSNPFMLRLGARLTVGLKAPEAPPLDRWVPYIYFQSEILRYLEAVALVGARTDRLEPRLTVLESDLAESRRVVPETEVPLVVLHPGASDPQRRWPPEKFAAVGDALAAAGAHVLVTGIPREQPLVEAVLGAMRAEAQSLCGALSLGGLAGLLARCRVVVSNDTGPLHVAAAVGTATVGIYWCGNLITAGPLSRTRHRPAISWRLECPRCGRNCLEGNCRHPESFVADVATEEVIASALELLEPEFSAASI